MMWIMLMIPVIRVTFLPVKKGKNIIIYAKDIRWIQIMHVQTTKQSQSEQENEQTNKGNNKPRGFINGRTEN